MHFNSTGIKTAVVKMKKQFTSNKNTKSVKLTNEGYRYNRHNSETKCIRIGRLAGDFNRPRVRTPTTFTILC